VISDASARAAAAARERLGAGGDELGGEAGLLGVGRQQGDGLGDGGVVAADEVVC